MAQRRYSRKQLSRNMSGIVHGSERYTDIMEAPYTAYHCRDGQMGKANLVSAL
jgi:hypothetical protein